MRGMDLLSKLIAVCLYADGTYCEVDELNPKFRGVKKGGQRPVRIYLHSAEQQHYNSAKDKMSTEGVLIVCA